MKRLPIHVRVTAWYLLSLTVILTLFAIGSWYAMKASMYHSIDRDLGYRMLAVAPFIESHSLHRAARIQSITFRACYHLSVCCKIRPMITGFHQNHPDPKPPGLQTQGLAVALKGKLRRTVNSLIWHGDQARN